MADYIIGGILVALAILALRSVFKKTSSGGCAGCSGCNGCGPSCHGQGSGNCLQISDGMADACGVEALQIIDKSF